MSPLLLRALRALVLGVVVFLAVRYLSGNATTALGVGLVPVTLGLLNVGARAVAALTVVSVSSAAFWFDTPPDLKARIRSVLTRIVAEAQQDDIAVLKIKATARGSVREHAAETAVPGEVPGKPVSAAAAAKPREPVVNGVTAPTIPATKNQ